MQEIKSHVLVCILCGPERHHWINPELVRTLLRMQNDSRFAVEFEFIYGAHGVDTARNLAIDKARAKQADWCVQIDNDMTCNDPLDILSEAHTLGLEIVAVSCGISMAENDYRPNVNLQGERCGNFMRVSNAGADVLMVKSAVWSKLPNGPLFVWSSACGEDVYFCRLAQAANFKLWTHASLAGHLKTVNLSSLLAGVRK